MGKLPPVPTSNIGLKATRCCKVERRVSFPLNGSLDNTGPAASKGRPYMKYIGGILLVLIVGCATLGGYLWSLAESFPSCDAQETLDSVGRIYAEEWEKKFNESAPRWVFRHVDTNERKTHHVWCVAVMRWTFRQSSGPPLHGQQVVYYETFLNLEGQHITSARGVVFANQGSTDEMADD